MGLVWSMVRRFANRGVEMEDLCQIGSIGLLKAIDKFDPSFEVCFSTYAVPMIAGEIRRFLRSEGMVKVSRPIRELAWKAYAVRERLERENGRDPTLAEIAGELDVTVEEIVEAMEDVYKRQRYRLRNEIQIKVVPRNFRPLHACYVYVKGVFDLRQASAGINTTIHQT